MFIQRPCAGISLVEVIISLAILTLGVLAAALLQSSALTYQRSAQVLQYLTTVAEGEMEAQRQRRLTHGVAACHAEALEHSCHIDVTACQFIAGVVHCNTTVTEPALWHIKVSVSHPQLQHPFVLSTLLRP